MNPNRQNDANETRPELDAALNEAVERFLTPRPPRDNLRDDELIQRGTGLALYCGLAATAWGEGPPVVLVHGWESRRTHWSAFVNPLVERGFRAIAVDAPAHGDSPGETTDVVDYGRTLVEVGRQIGPLAGVVAHSFGVGATVIALHRGLAVARAALISGPASLAAVLERWGRGYGLLAQDIPHFIAMIERKVGEPMTGLDLTRLALDLTTPALIVHDRNDKEIPVEDAVALAAAWQGAKTFITDRYGHRRIMFASEVVCEIVEFLTVRETMGSAQP